MSSGKLNCEQQIQVVIRLKPELHQHQPSKCVYLSDQQNQLVVETSNKKQFFLFDNIADENCTQQNLYNQIGREAFQFFTKGYNCCIFAYGQTGAGKTYSILGKQSDLNTNIYAQSRGILPRLLDELFVWVKQQTLKCSVICSYLEIYNQQIFDLLNTQIKVRQIREDFKKGIFVEGLSQQNANCYETAMDILMRGLKNRKVAATSMNAESSRSHTIFSINLEFQIKQEETIKNRKCKINIVDLAGSQRAKLTKVQGQRLKEGCNINKSLHVLGNVINALIESAKKKKHIPFRDSKLTYLLKDSLGGNSVTKLLANIQPSKKYLSETLSTLMFAKRAKILRMKVEINQNPAQNFDYLRTQIRKLRQQLAQARYIKNQSKLNQKCSDDQQEINSIDKFIDTSEFDMVKHEKVLQVFEQNQLNYKAIIQIYEEHLKHCSSSNNNQQKKGLHIHHEWKALQKKNQALSNLVKNFPAFTKIFKQNLILRNDLEKRQDGNDLKISRIKKNKDFLKLEPIVVQDYETQLNKLPSPIILQIEKNYQKLLTQIQLKVQQQILILEKAYEQLVHQNKEKDDKIKELMKRKQSTPQIQALLNQNQYLKLNILELQSQLNTLAQKKKHRKSSENIVLQKGIISVEQFLNVVSNLEDIKQQAELQIAQIEADKQQTQKIINLLKEELNKLGNDYKKMSKQFEQNNLENKQLKKKISQLLNISSENQIIKEFGNTFWTNQQSLTEDIIGEYFPQKKLDDEKSSKRQIDVQLQQKKSTIEIATLHQNYQNQISLLNQELKKFQQQNCFIRKDINQFKIYQDQFGKSYTEIIEEYRKFVKKDEGNNLKKNFHSPKALKQRQLDLKQKTIRKLDEKKQFSDMKNKNLMKSSNIFKGTESKKEEPPVSFKSKK